MKVDQVLKENQDQVSISDISFIASGLDQNRQGRLNTALQGIQADEVLKSHWNEYKTVINRRIEEAGKVLYSDLYLDYIREDESRRQTMPTVYSELYYGNFTMVGYKKLLRLVGKIKDNEIIEPLYSNAKKLLAEIEKVANTVALTKDHIVNTQQRQAEKKTKEEDNWKILTSNKDVKKVMETLTTLTNDIRAESEKATRVWLYSIANHMQTAIDENPKRRITSIFRDRSFELSIGYRLAEYNRGIMSLNKDWKKILNKQAKDIVGAMVDQFIYKNTAKLAGIVSTKNNMKTIEIINASTGAGVIEGTMKLTFKDGSSFTVKNSVVSSYSKYGTFFYRFPTTFHNVVMSDGSKMKGPSEKEMNTTFVQ